MHLATHESEALAELGEKITSISKNLLEGLTPSAPVLTLTAATDLFNSRPASQIYQILDGQVSFEMAGKTVAQFERGDLIGLTRMLSLPAGTFSSNDPVRLQPLERDELITHVFGSESLQKLWSYYLVAQLSWYQQALAQEMRKEFQPSAGFLHFAPGETIIHQGDEADLVYTLLEGSADAICDGVKVGQIFNDEIFGALAVFTGQKRIASVVATSDCTVLTVRKEEFIELVEHQPHICIGLIEEMADKIKQLNGQLLAVQEA
ncbi:cyclic nucleotide-binding domain-containing protein [Gilvimarinus algae]|uniref:Cyclic nucleotide-binding domain-containing protein n=1 Tax=Gilvimarinus algae TaxID=3058037 RepID=A0ABT8TCV6_9GAMM|nr:cyclic nucleotide-binding domain-containing protein [Gilvimarinus sp. SDUM040014]MDO3381947.1 cyclic nucleotide-binding domain-containing protein [Gilvimarinus sp. SDUM040014]